MVRAKALTLAYHIEMLQCCKCSAASLLEYFQTFLGVLNGSCLILLAIWTDGQLVN